MSSYFGGKVVWVTGASSGIGEEFTRQIVVHGPKKIIISARSTSKLEKLRSEFPDVDIDVVPLDLSNPEKVYDIASQWVKINGSVDVLFNNGGISQRSGVKETEMSVYRNIMDVNFFGSVALTKVVLPGMIQKGKGHLIATSSVVGKIGSPMRSGYAASKHALHGFFDSLRAELPESIKVSLVLPGYIKTDISKNAVVGDGSQHGKMDSNQEQGMTVKTMVAKLLKALEAGKSEIIIGGKETMGIYLGRFLPRVLERVLRNIKVTDE